MPTNDFKPFAADPGANVVDQATYESLLAPSGALEDGFEAGLAESNQFNKVMRQAAVVSHTIAQFISDTLGADVLDDGDLAALLVQLTEAITLVGSSGTWTTGDIKLTLKNVADTGWLMCDDGTIGDATSGADYANAAAEDLFLLLWNNVANTWAPVSTGRGLSAAADWAAHKRISLTRMLGRALAISGSGSGLTARSLGEYLGSETITLATANLPAHSHTITDPGHTHGVTDPGHTHVMGGTAGGGGSGAVSVIGASASTASSVTGLTVNSASTGITTQNTGSGTAKDVMNPMAYLNAMIKL